MLKKRIYGCKIDAAADGQKNALECSTLLSPINVGLFNAALSLRGRGLVTVLAQKKTVILKKP